MANRADWVNAVTNRRWRQAHLRSEISDCNVLYLQRSCKKGRIECPSSHFSSVTIYSSARNLAAIRCRQVFPSCAMRRACRA